MFSWWKIYTTATSCLAVGFHVHATSKTEAVNKIEHLYINLLKYILVLVVRDYGMHSQKLQTTGFT